MVGEGVSDFNGIAVGVPKVGAGVDHSRCTHCWVDVQLRKELACLVVEVLDQWDTLGRLQIGASKGFYLPLLEGSVRLPKAFGASAGRGGEVTIVLVLPVGPTCEIVISDLRDLSDLLSAWTLC